MVITPNHLEKQVLKEDWLKKNWLDNLLTDHLEHIVTYWALRHMLPFAENSSNFLMSATQFDVRVVAKLSHDTESLKREIRTLKLFQEFGSIQILESEDFAMLLERAKPGYPLAHYFPKREQESIEIVCNVMKKLHKAPFPKNVNLPHLEDILKVLDNASVLYIEEARAVRDELLDSAFPDVLLHGDLHHNNILKHGDDWVVIDPKGVIGDAAYEVACFVRNPMPRLLSAHSPKEIIRARVKSFAKELNMDEKRIANWCFVGAVLSHVWAIEDGIDERYFMKIVNITHTIRSKILLDQQSFA